MSELLEERLRKAAQTCRNLGNHTAEGMFLEAADAITELRGALLVASIDYRHLSEENAKLRELLADILMQPRDYCQKYGIEYDSWDSVNEHLDARMRELGVDDG